MDIKMIQTNCGSYFYEVTSISGVKTKITDNQSLADRYPELNLKTVNTHYLQDLIQTINILK